MTILNSKSILTLAFFLLFAQNSIAPPPETRQYDNSRNQQENDVETPAKLTGEKQTQIADEKEINTMFNNDGKTGQASSLTGSVLNQDRERLGQGLKETALKKPEQNLETNKQKTALKSPGQGSQNLPQGSQGQPATLKQQEVDQSRESPVQGSLQKTEDKGGIIPPQGSLQKPEDKPGIVNPIQENLQKPEDQPGIVNSVQGSLQKTEDQPGRVNPIQGSLQKPEDKPGIMNPVQGSLQKPEDQAGRVNQVGGQQGNLNQQGQTSPENQVKPEVKAPQPEAQKTPAEGAAALQKFAETKKETPAQPGTQAVASKPVQQGAQEVANKPSQTGVKGVEVIPPPATANPSGQQPTNAPVVAPGPVKEPKNETEAPMKGAGAVDETILGARNSEVANKLKPSPKTNATSVTPKVTGSAPLAKSGPIEPQKPTPAPVPSVFAPPSPKEVSKIPQQPVESGEEEKEIENQSPPSSKAGQPSDKQSTTNPSSVQPAAKIGSKYRIPFYPQGESSHFMTYLISTGVLVALAYILFHNKQKILGLIVEGRAGSEGSRRRPGARYQRLENQSDEDLRADKPSMIIY